METSYWEKFLYTYNLDWSNPPPNFEESWKVSGIVYSEVANYLLYHDTNIGNSLSDMKQWILNNRIAWRTTKSSAIYNDTLNRIYRANRDIYYLFTSSENPDFFIALGFANLQQFYAWCAFICAWVYSITKESSVKGTGIGFLNMYLFGAVDQQEREIWKTPASTDKTTMNNFANKVMAYCQPFFDQQILPLLHAQNVSAVRTFASQLIKDAKDTIGLAVKTGGEKEEETMDWGKIALGAVLFWGFINLVKR
jgi:hypothetical protein